MNLLDHLKKKRDELRPNDLHFRKECGDYTCGAHKSWDEGFTSACAELLPMIEKMENALERQQRYTENNENELVELHSFAIAREALDELNKWRES